MSRQRELMLVLALFVGAAVVAFVFWSILPAEYRENQSTDYLGSYEPVARSILAGRGITLDGEIAVRYAPGFPMLLAGVFRAAASLGMADETLLLAFRLLCVGLSAVLVYGLARLVWSPGLALIPALAWMTYPFFLWLAKQPNSEVPFVPVLYTAFLVFWWAMLRGRGGARLWMVYLTVGLLAGAAMLIRPAAIGLSVVLAVVVVLFAARATPLRARLGYGALIVAGSLILTLPWVTAVYARTGEVIPLSSGGKVTLLDGFTFLAVPKDYRREVAIPEDVTDLMWAVHQRRNETATTARTLAVIGDEAREAPAAFAKLMVIKLVRSWYGIDSRILEIPTLLLQAIYLLLILWGSIYSWRRGGALRRMTGGNWIVVLYFWGMTFVVIPLFRYMVPVMGLLMLALPGVYLSLAERRGRAVAGQTDAHPPGSPSSQS